MRIGRFVLALVVCLWPAAVLCQRQPSAAASKPTPFVVRAVGGFLGQVAGFPEYPGGPNDDFRGLSWLGGTLGVSTWLKDDAYDHGDPNAWLIVAPNNQTSDLAQAVKAKFNPLEILSGVAASAPRDARMTLAASDVSRLPQWFWRDIAQMKPDVVALGPEDFIRWLRLLPPGQKGKTPESAALLVDFVRSSGLPFLASNVVIHRHRDDLNVGAPGPIKWNVSDDESVSWLDSVKLTIPCSAQVHVTLKAGTDPVSAKIDDKPAKCATTYEAKLSLDGDGPLAPGTKYTLDITGSARQQFVFSTDELLKATPEGKPYAVKCKDAASCTDAMVFALVDPSTKDHLGSADWKFTRVGDSSEQDEISFLDPAKVVRAFVPAKQEKLPLVTVVSALNDDTMLDLLDQIPEVRAVVLSADSQILGRAWAKMPDDQYSGDLGGAAAVDRGSPGSTRLFVRPEWFGETVGRIDVDAERVADNGLGYWNLHVPAAVKPCPALPVPPGISRATTSVDRTPIVDVCDVVGWELQHSVDQKPATYTAHDIYHPNNKTVYPLWTGQPYEPAFGRQWADSDDLTAVMADAIRRAGHSEIAVLPKNALDPDFLAWVASAIKDHDDWLSNYLVERVLYRSPRMVRGYIAGADLASTLKKIADGDKPDGVCIIGIGDRCAATVAADAAESLQVDGRPVDPRLTYSIALPDRIAEALEIAHSEHDPQFDTINAVEDDFANYELGKGQAPEYPHAINGISGYWLTSTGEIGFSSVNLRDPSGFDRSQLTIDSKDAKRSRAFSVNLENDLAVADTPNWIVRIPTVLNYSRRVEGPDAEVSHDTDEFSVSPRAERKFRIIREARVYFGGTFSGALSSSSQKLVGHLTVKQADGRDAKESVTLTTQLGAPPSRYKALDAGFELVPTSKHPLWPNTTISITSAAIDLARGRTSNVLQSIAFDDEVQDATNLVLSGGLQKLLDDFFAAHPDTFSEATGVTATRAPQTEWRQQYDGAADVVTQFGKTKVTWSPALRLRFYRPVADDASPFTVTSTIKLNLGVSWPMWSQLAVKPAVEWDRATLKNSMIFRTLKAEIKFDFPIIAKWGHGRFWR